MARLEIAAVSRSEIFVGPTAARISPRLLASSFDQISGPIKAGDIDQRLAQDSSPRLLCIVDGYADPPLAMQNSEIQRALSLGWPVVGLSSIGALKATELHAFGMRGFGLVYRFLRRHRITSSEQVIAMHGIDPPYRRLSEPLIEIRALLNVLRRRGRISRDAVNSISNGMESRWFGDRTLKALRDALIPFVEHQTLSDTLSSDSWRVKTRDLVEFCACRTARSLD